MTAPTPLPLGTNRTLLRARAALITVARDERPALLEIRNQLLGGRDEAVQADPQVSRYFDDLARSLTFLINAIDAVDIREEQAQRERRLREGQG